MRIPKYLIFCNLFLGLTVLNAQEPTEANRLLDRLVSEDGNIGVTAGYSVDGQLRWAGTCMVPLPRRAW